MNNYGAIYLKHIAFTIKYEGFNIRYYISFPLVKGGGVWISGPHSYIGIALYKNKGYILYNGG